MQHRNRGACKQAENGDGGDSTHQQGMHDIQSLHPQSLASVEEKAVVNSDPCSQQQGDQMKQRQPFPHGAQQGAGQADGDQDRQYYPECRWYGSQSQRQDQQDSSDAKQQSLQCAVAEVSQQRSGGLFQVAELCPL